MLDLAVSLPHGAVDAIIPQRVMIIPVEAALMGNIVEQANRAAA